MTTKMQKISKTEHLISSLDTITKSTDNLDILFLEMNTDDLIISQKKTIHKKLNTIITHLESMSTGLKLVKDLPAQKNKNYERWNDPEISSGDLLKAALQIHNISQAELARKTHTQPQKISDLIHGRLGMSLFWAKKISKILNVDYRTLLKQD